jgi:hypothetical protein
MKGRGNTLTIKEALARVAELEAKNAKLKEDKELLRGIAKRYMSQTQRLWYEIGIEAEKHERATAIIADMGGYRK